MTPPPRIRELRPADAEGFARLLEDGAAAGAGVFFHPFPLTEATARRVLGSVHADRYLGAWLAGRLVGFAMLRGWDAGFEIPSFGILVDAGFRRRGIGTVLTRYALRLAGASGCRAVRLTVHSSNHAARRLFDRAGFGEVSRQPATGTEEAGQTIVMVHNSPRSGPTRRARSRRPTG